MPAEVADKDEGKEENTVTEEKEEKKETKREEKQNGDVERKTYEVPEPGNRNDLASSLHPNLQPIPSHPHPS